MGRVLHDWVEQLVLLGQVTMPPGMLAVKFIRTQDWITVLRERETKMKRQVNKLVVVVGQKVAISAERSKEIKNKDGVKTEECVNRETVGEL